MKMDADNAGSIRIDADKQRVELNADLRGPFMINVDKNKQRKS